MKAFVIFYEIPLLWVISLDAIYHKNNRGSQKVLKLKGEYKIFFKLWKYILATMKPIKLNLTTILTISIWVLKNSKYCRKQKVKMI